VAKRPDLPAETGARRLARPLLNGELPIGERRVPMPPRTYRTARLLGACAILLLACQPPQPDGAAGVIEQAMAQCPPAVTVEGIDIASWQHPNGAAIDWNQVVSSGKKFNIIKATQGTGYTNPYFADDYAQTKAHGMIAGAYHWLDPCCDGTSQAKYFLNVIGSYAYGDLPPMLDIEDTNVTNTGAYVQAIADWVKTIEQAVGRKPMLYSGNWYWSGHLGNPPGYGDYPISWSWYANGCPQVPDDHTGITIWQYAGGVVGGCPGISGECDLDKFYGTEVDLLSFAQPLPAKAPVEPGSGVRRHIASPDVMTAWRWSFRDDALLSDADFNAYPPGLPVPAAPQLVVGMDDPTVYLIDSGYKRSVVSPTVLKAWRWTFGDVQKVPQPMVDAVPEGPPLLDSPYLIQNPAGSVELVDVPLPPMATDDGGTSATDGGMPHAVDAGHAGDAASGTMVVGGCTLAPGHAPRGAATAAFALVLLALLVRRRR
jgi:GH25 family lysozyme M1 (1,4-beta-N-acetylmuramidase)